MYGNFIKFFIFLVVICYSLGLFYYDDKGILNLDDFLDSLNEREMNKEQEIIISDLKKVILVL